MFLVTAMMSVMSDTSDTPKNKIDEDKLYMTGAAAAFIGLSGKQVGRLVDAGVFPNARRKSRLPNSPRVIPGSDLIKYLEQQQS